MPVAKITRGSSALGCLGYVLGKADAELLETNCDGETPDELHTEFDLALEVHLRNGAQFHTILYICHVGLGFGQDCPLERETLLAIAHDYMEGMGFDPLMNQYVIVAHHDTEHQHIHLVINRVRLDGVAVSAAWEHYRSNEVLAQLEAKYDLKRLRHLEGADTKAPTVGEIRKARHDGKPIPRQVMQETIERCLVPGQSLQQFTEQLKEEGMTLLTVEKPNGLALLYQLEVDSQLRTFSASKLGRKYTKKGLQSSYAMSFDDQLETEAAKTVSAIEGGMLATEGGLTPSDPPLSPELQVVVTTDIETTASLSNDEADSLSVSTSLAAAETALVVCGLNLTTLL